jgi:hypothetical protein
MVMQIGPPPNMYSPSADFVARVQLPAGATAASDGRPQPLYGAPPSFAASPMMGCVVPSPGPVYSAPGMYTEYSTTVAPPHVSYAPAVYGIPQPPMPMYVPAQSRPWFTVASNDGPQNLPSCTCEAGGCQAGCCDAAGCTGYASMPAPQPQPGLMYPTASAGFPALPTPGRPAAFTSPTTGMADRLDHILQAAQHLDAAGLDDEADELRRRSNQDMLSVIHALKTSEAELTQLRQASYQRAEGEWRRASSAKASADGHAVPQILFHVEMLEVNLTKCRNLGIDPAALDGTFTVSSSNSKELEIVRKLQQAEAATVVCNPVITTVSGRRAEFFSGQEIPFITPHGDTVSIDYKKIGTEMKLLPTIVDRNQVRLQIHTETTKLPHGESAGHVTADKLEHTRMEIEEVMIGLGNTLVLPGGIESKTVSATRHRHVSKELSDGEIAQQLVAEEIQEDQEIQTLLLVRSEIVEPTDTAESRFTDIVPTAESDCEARLEIAQADCQCTCSGCTKDCAAGLTACTCDEHCFDCPSWTSQWTAPPIWLEVGGELDQSAMAQPYDVIPAAFNLSESHADQPSFQFYQGMTR